jgi:hypothetical protein
MAVFRVHKTKDFTVMSNHHLRDKNLTLKAKGLLSVILSLPDDWKYSIAGLAAICKEGTSAVKSALQELTDAGYVTVTKLYPNQTETGRIEYVYDIHEFPQKQEWEKQPTVFQPLENPTLQRTKDKREREVGFSCLGESGAREESQVDSSSTYDFQVSGGFVPPTLEEVRAYVSGNMLDRCDPDLFFATYDAQGWMLGNGLPMTNWQSAVRKWHVQDRNKSAAKKRDDFSDLAGGWDVVDERGT